DVDTLPGAAELPRGREAGTLGNVLHVELALQEELAGDGNAQAIAVVDDSHTDLLLEEPRQMPAACAGDARELRSGPAPCWILCDGVLHAMYGGMNVIASFQPRRELRV